MIATTDGESIHFADKAWAAFRAVRLLSFLARSPYMNAEDLYRRAPPWLQTLLMNAYATGIHLHRYGRPFRSAVASLQDQERWPAERIRSWQLAHLREVTHIAFSKSPFYRDRFEKAGIEPRDLRSFEDLREIPILTKDMIRSTDLRMITAPSPRPTWLNGHTSGTTGSPLGIWYDRNTCVMTNAVDRQQKVWGGVGRGDWTGVFLGRMIVPLNQRQPPFWRANHVQKEIWFSSFHMSPDSLPAYVREAQRKQLRFLEGYPSTLFILAQYLLREEQRLPMHAVFTSSETLHDLQRETITQAFQCPIFDYYGHAERAVFAMECQHHSGKHLAETYGFVEVVDDLGNPLPDGELGHLIGTSLHNQAMPMIRYKTGDITRVLPEACRCGRTHRRVSDVTTKAEDIVLTPEGRMISPSVLTHPFKPFDSIRKSQVIQESRTQLIVKLICDEEFTDEDEQALRLDLMTRLGSEMHIHIRRVSDIPNDSSGKFRWVISKVSHENRFEWTRDLEEGQFE